MSADRTAFNAEVMACLNKDVGVAALLDCIASHFPNLEVFRENDDLIIKHGGVPHDALGLFDKITGLAGA